MARARRAAARNNGRGDLGFEATLWQAADKLRGNLDSGEYKHVVLGLIFLKYISDAFDEARAQIVKDPEGDPEERDEYVSRNVFWVPLAARWEFLQAKAKDPDIGKLLDDAMDAIEHDNPRLKGVLPKDYARPALDKRRLGELIDLIGTVGLGNAENRSKDIIGRVYEYFLGRFASAEGKKGGEFYTPRPVVLLLVEMLAPQPRSRIYDPCCGSGGMFVQSERFIEEHGGRKGDVSIFGQELNWTTWRLCQMNLAIRGIEGRIEQGDTFHANRLPDLKADYILANPPFNVSDWGGEHLRDDVRWQFGIPPAGNANFAWVQHFIHHLAPTGVAGFILGNISLSSETGGEDEIRRRLLDANLVDCIVSLPDRLFYSTPIAACIWIVSRDRQNRREPRDRVLFIDASQLGAQVTRTHSELTPDAVTRISGTYRRWLASDEGYVDEEGFCRSVPIDEIRDNRSNLLPAGYVGRGHIAAQGSPRLRDVLQGESRAVAARRLNEVREAALEWDENIRTIDSQVDEIARNISFETVSLGHLLERSDRRLGDGEEPEILTVTESGGLVLQRERFAKRVATDDVRTYKLVSQGDIIYNPYLLWKGAIDQCWIVTAGLTSPAYEVFRVRNGLNAILVGQLVTSPEMKRRYDGISFGTVQRRRRAPVDRFLDLKVSVPTGDSLAAVAALLDASERAQIASRSSERAIRSFVREFCERLR